MKYDAAFRFERAVILPVFRQLLLSYRYFFDKIKALIGNKKCLLEKEGLLSIRSFFYSILSEKRALY
jgi:hypothetical protein